MRRVLFFGGALLACEAPLPPPPSLDIHVVSLAEVSDQIVSRIAFVFQAGDRTGEVITEGESIPFVGRMILPEGFETEFLHVTATAFIGETEVATGAVDVSPGETEATIRFALCSNGAPEETEACDDGNLTEGDGCDSTCKPTGCGSGVSTVGELCFFENDNLLGPEGPLQVLAQDLNGDQLPDLVAPYRAFEGAPEVVRIFLNNGGAFGSFQEISLPGAKKATLGDMDSDGDLDVVVTTKGNNAPGVAVLFNDEGTFSIRQQQFLSASDVSDVALASLDGDGIPDLVYTDPVGNAVHVVLSLSTGGFSTQEQSFAVGAQPIALALADLDGNGHIDAVTANASGSVSVLMNNGAVFVAGLPISIGGVPSSLALGEFDTQAGLDLAVAKQDTGGKLRLFRGNGDGNFQFVADFAATDSPSALIAADLDQDGDIDLAATSRSASVIGVLFNNGEGQFDPPQDASGGIFGTRQGPVSLAVSDLNNDQVPDLIAAGQNLGVLLSNP